MVQEYTSAPHDIRTLTWPSASTGELIDLVGVDNVTVTIAGVVQVRNADGEWTTLESGRIVAVTDRGERLVLSPGAHAIQYQPKKRADHG